MQFRCIFRFPVVPGICGDDVRNVISPRRHCFDVSGMRSDTERHQLFVPRAAGTLAGHNCTPYGAHPHVHVVRLFYEPGRVPGVGEYQIRVSSIWHCRRKHVIIDRAYGVAALASH